MPNDRIQQNRTTGEYRILTEAGWQPYTPPAETPRPARYEPGLADTPTTAIVNELARTGKEAGIGLARSPVDAVKGLFQLAAHPIEAVKGTARAVAHPVETFNALGDNPREAGSILGQLLLGKVGLPKVPAALARVPEAVSAAGRGAETAGTALAESKIGGFGIPGLGALEAITRGDPTGLAVAASPYALKYGGKGLQKVGGGLEALKEALLRPSATPDEAGTVSRWHSLPKSTEVPYRSTQTPTPHSAFEKMSASGRFGGDRTVGHFEEGPLSLSNTPNMARYEAPFDTQIEAEFHRLPTRFEYEAPSGPPSAGLPNLPRGDHEAQLAELEQTLLPRKSPAEQLMASPSFKGLDTAAKATPSPRVAPKGPRVSRSREAKAAQAKLPKPKPKPKK